MKNDDFFEEATEQSLIKATIVAKYFWAWAKVIMPTAKKYGNNIAYIDLFAGPGRYKDGAKSTPLLILEKAIQDADMRQMLVTIFNDADMDHSESLKQAISELEGIETLRHQPQIFSREVGAEVVKLFERTKGIPTFFFVDPWGYKGLSLQLVNSVLQNWGCDCIFFFNYNRINMGLPNRAVDPHMDALFGYDRAEALRRKLETLESSERELTIIEELAQALKEMGGTYVLPFRFKNITGTRTSHYLIFVSKNFRGYEIMKEIMAHESSVADQGVPSFEYSIASTRQPALFELSRPLDNLAEMLLEAFAGQQLTMHEIYLRHSIDRPYIEKNYKDVLKQLEAGEQIITDPPASKRRRIKGVITFGDEVVVTFPKRSH